MGDALIESQFSSMICSCMEQCLWTTHSFPPFSGGLGAPGRE